MQPAKKDFPVPTSPQMRSPEAFAFMRGGCGQNSGLL